MNVREMAVSADINVRTLIGRVLIWWRAVLLAALVCAAAFLPIGYRLED